MRDASTEDPVNLGGADSGGMSLPLSRRSGSLGIFFPRTRRRYVPGMGASVLVDKKNDYGDAEPVARTETAQLLRGPRRLIWVRCTTPAAPLASGIE